MSRYAKFRLGPDAEAVLVEHVAVRRFDHGEARRMLQAASEDPQSRHVIRELARAQSFGAMPTDDQAHDIVVRLLADGVLVCVRLERDLSTWATSARRADGSDAHDHIPYLRDMRPASDPRRDARPSASRPRPSDSGTDVPHSPVVREHRGDTFVAFAVVDQDGAAVRGRFWCAVEGTTHDGELDQAPTRIQPIALESSAALTFAPVGYLAPSRPGPPSSSRVAAGDVAIDVADEIGPVALVVGTTTRIAVQVPKATVFTLPAYGLDLEVFRPGWLWFDDATSEGTSGLGCLAQMLGYAREHPERFVLIVGHTDTTGSKTHNRGVAERRATHLAALLQGDVDAWVASCEAFGETVDLAAHVCWAAHRFGWSCDGGMPSTVTDELREALAEYRRRAGEAVGIHIDPERSPCSEDWQIAYALLDLALAEELDLDLAALASLRAGVRWCDPSVIGAGELWPRELVGKDGKKSAVNRRTEVLFATVAEIPGGAGEPPGQTVFGDDAWLWLDYIDPERRAALALSLVSTDGHPVPETPMRIVSEHGRVRYGRLDAQGEAFLVDVAAGEFRVHYLEHDDVTVKVWASRFDTAVRAADAGGVRRLLALPAELVQAIAREYGERFASGDAGALGDRARDLARGRPDEVAFDFLLTLAGFVGEHEYDVSLVQAPPTEEPTKEPQS